MILLILVAVITVIYTEYSSWTEEQAKDPASSTAVLPGPESESYWNEPTPYLRRDATKNKTKELYPDIEASDIPASPEIEEADTLHLSQ